MHRYPRVHAERHKQPGKRIAILVACLFALASLMRLGPAMAQSHTHQHAFRDAQKWAQVFDDPQRDAWQKPDEVISTLALPLDAVVADVGAGTGYFAARLARVLARGVVYAVDIEPEMVKYLTDRAQRENLPNMRSISGTPDDPRLPKQVDLILLVDTYHHIGARERYFSKLRAMLKPGGRLAVIDFKLDSPTGPPKEVRIAPDSVKQELSSAGYSLEKEHSFLPHQYFLVFTARR